MRREKGGEGSRKLEAEGSKRRWNGWENGGERRLLREGGRRSKEKKMGEG